jgi:hypothetical protein
MSPRVRLNPSDPPGRVNRKARAFEAEIARLRCEGYTCEAIRAALAAIGVDVSLSTVQREAKRRSRVVAKASGFVTTGDVVAAPTSATRPSSSLVGDPRTGKEIAAAFFEKRVSNPLLRDRSNPS